MAFTVPDTVNYKSPLVYVQSNVLREPREGRRQFNLNVDWGDTLYAAKKAVNFNFQQNATLDFSQIVCLVVDNSDCGADVRFYFPDTQMTMTIPAYTPYAIVEVMTAARSFILQTGLSNQVVLPTDMTRFQVLNYLPPPVVVPTSDEQQPAAVSAIDGTVVASNTIVAATISGRLESASIVGFFTNNTANTATWRLIDGAGTIIATGRNASIGDDFINIDAFNNYNMKVPFKNGLFFEITQSDLPAGSQYAVNLYYRQR